jgi:hypothetical protein
MTRCVAVEPLPDRQQIPDRVPARKRHDP